MRKAVSFALIGLVNTFLDAGVFLLAFGFLTGSVATERLFGFAARLCLCGDTETLILVAANVAAWLVAVTSSYVMNSTITFAAESGRALRLGDYVAFVASGALGVVVNTATLVFAAQALHVWAAKTCAILAGFVVNFAMSNFVVFRAPRS